MSFRKYGGTQFASSHNIVKSNVNTTGSFYVTENVGQPNTYINFESDISGNMNIYGNLDVSGNIHVSGNVDISGNLTTSKDATINTLRVGLGGGNNTTNVVVGSYAFTSNTSGTYNIAIGFNSLLNNTTGANNAAIGITSLKINTTGSSNASFGNNSLLHNISGNNNTAVGVNSLTNNTGSSNTGIGNDSGYNITTGSNNTCIGFTAAASSATVSNEITLGNSSISTLRCQVTSITSLSDARDKKEIEPLEAGLQFVDQLKPVKFIWNMRDGGKVDIPDMGFIAQDLQQVQKDTGITIPNLVYESNPDKLEVSYGTLLPILVKAVQELSAEVKALKIELNELKNK